MLLQMQQLILQAYRMAWLCAVQTVTEMGNQTVLIFTAPITFIVTIQSFALMPK